MQRIWYPYAHTPAATLIVLLPGIYDRPADFARAGFVQAVRAYGPDADLVAVGAGYSYYRARSVVPHLERDVIGPARRAGYRHIWLVGVSLGGLGALLYLKDHPGRIDGIVLLSPYLGEPRRVGEVAAAGALAAWEPGPQCGTDPMCELWRWLRAEAGDGRIGSVPVLLGYGSRDRFPAAHRLLAQALGRGHSLVVEGGHDWATWLALWQRMLQGATGGRMAAIDAAK